MLQTVFNIEHHITPDGTLYYYVMRPSNQANEKRGVGGYFKMDKNYSLTGFREIFVTPILPEAEVKGCSFLFEEMIDHDTITYEWKTTQGTF